MIVTEEGNVTPVRPVQLSKAVAPMVVTVEGTMKAPFFPSGKRTNVVLSALYSTPFSLT